MYARGWVTASGTGVYHASTLRNSVRTLLPPQEQTGNKRQTRPIPGGLGAAASGSVKNTGVSLATVKNTVGTPGAKRGTS